MPITTNQGKPSGYVVIRAVASEGLLLNTTTGEVAGANTINELVQEMTISELIWTGDWEVTRGGNTVFATGNTATSGHFDFQAANMRLEENVAQLTSNVDVVLTTERGSIMLKLHKKSGQG